MAASEKPRTSSRFGCIGAALEVICEVLDPLPVAHSHVGFLRELADRHVLDHVPTQRAAPVLSEGCQALISRQDALIRYIMVRARGGTALRQSGLVP
jgi:hypothetical protein